jgi:hypothetical protein
MKWPLARIRTIDYEIEANLPKTEEWAKAFELQKTYSRDAIPMGTIVLRFRDVLDFDKIQPERDELGNLLAHKNEQMTSEQITATLTKILQQAIPDGAFQLMWNCEAKDETGWLNIFLIRNTIRAKFKFDNAHLVFRPTDGFWFVEARFGGKFGPLQIYLRFRRRKHPNSHFEFWVSLDGEIKASDLFKAPVDLPHVPKFQVVKFKRLVLSTAIRCTFSEETSVESASSKPRKLSYILVFALICTIGLIYLNYVCFNNPDEYAHYKTFGNALVWVTAVAYSIGIPRTIIFWGHTCLGWGVGFCCAAGFASYFGLSIYHLSLSTVLLVNGGLFIIYDTVPALFGIALVSLTFGTIGLAVIIALTVWNGEYKGNPMVVWPLAIVVIVILIAIAVGLAFLSEFFHRRHDKIKKEGFFNRNAASRDDSSKNKS